MRLLRARRINYCSDPYRLRVDWSNPINDRLILCSPLSDGVVFTGSGVLPLYVDLSGSKVYAAFEYPQNINYLMTLVPTPLKYWGITDGPFGPAALARGENAYISYGKKWPVNVYGNTNAGGFSFTIWFRRDGNGSGVPRLWEGAGYLPVLAVGDGTAIPLRRIGMYTASLGWVDCGVSVTDSVWTNITMTYDGAWGATGVFRVYKDAVLAYTSGSTNLSLTSASFWGTIGGTSSGAEQVNGGLSMARVYSRPLSYDEVLTLYHDPFHGLEYVEPRLAWTGEAAAAAGSAIPIFLKQYRHRWGA